MIDESDYEKQRKTNVQENRRVLESLGLLKPFKSLPPRNRIFANTKRPLKRKREAEERKVQKSKIVEKLSKPYGENNRRRSLRLNGQTPDHGLLLDNEKTDDFGKAKPSRSRPSHSVKRENVFGEIPGISVGTTWLTRLECSQDGVHRPTVAGIHGSETEGCYSLALSGGYEDDIDLGDSFTYTGEGGRDLKGTKSNPKNLRTAPQSKDQTLTKGNLALSRNVENGRPVRVIRGYKMAGIYAPEEGYRYDGLYKVERYWQAVGLGGYKVYKFVLSRCPDQDPSPWLSSSLHTESQLVNNEECVCESDSSR